MMKKQKIVITGAAGFLGGRTAKYLAQNFKDYSIVATSRSKGRNTEIESFGCQFINGDLVSESFCKQLTEGADIIVHCAALSAPFGPHDTFYNSNYIATRNLLNAGRANSVKKFVYISTPSIYFNFLDRFDIKESDPLPQKLVNNYATTKLEAEKMVLSSNTDPFQTIALRPRAIIGAEDTVILPRVLKAYHEGKLKIIGNGKNICDFTCVSNVIEAILCSIKAEPHAFGEAYNITDDNPIEFWKGLNYAFELLNLPPPTKKVPKNLAMFVARIVELKAKLFDGEKEPAITRYGIGILANNFTLDISKAKQKLGYQPKMNTFEGIKEYADWHKKTQK